MKTAISMRLPEELTKALDALARAVDRPKTYLIRKAIEAYLDEYADYQIALDRLRDKDEAILGGEELRRRIGL